MASVSYPNGDVVQYAYGDHGLPISLRSSVAGTIVSAATYNGQGKPYDLTLGNGLTTQYRYWGTADYNPGGSNSHYGMLRSVGTGSLQGLTYDYDAKGNVTSLGDSRNGDSLTYGYDHLDRLLSASSPISESYSYSAIGCLLTRGSYGFGYPTAGYPRPHAPVTISPEGGFTYDDNGSLVTSEGRTYSYDIENRLTSVSQGGTTIRAFTYDGDGTLRSVTESGTLTTRYVTPDYQVDVPSGEPTVYYRFGGRAVAYRTGTSPVRYLLADHLGSTHGETNSAGAETAQRRYTPFGSDRPVSGASDLPRAERYTGQKRIESGGANPLLEIYHYGARWYLPGVGIFTQPDTIVPNPANPQALNRYQYCGGNPTKLTDPTGHSGVADSDDNLKYPEHLDAALREAYKRLWQTGLEGRQLALYLLATDPVVKALAGSPGGGLTLSAPGLGLRGIAIGTAGRSVRDLAVLLGHETTHLIQNDAAGNPVVSQADEIAAYQVGGRLAQQMGIPDEWSSPTAQAYTVKDGAARQMLYTRMNEYRVWPEERPRSVTGLENAGMVQLGAIGAKLSGADRVFGSMAGAISSAAGALMASPGPSGPAGADPTRLGPCAGGQANPYCGM